MRSTKEIIADLRHNIEWSQPNIRHNALVTLVNELEQALDSTPKTIIHPPVAVNEIPLTPTVEIVEANEEPTTQDESTTPKKGRKPSSNNP